MKHHYTDYIISQSGPLNLLSPMFILADIYNDVMTFIPAHCDVPYKQSDRIILSYRKLFPYNSLIREYTKRILDSNLLARNENVFPTLAKEYATLIAIAKETKAQYNKLKFDCTADLQRDFIDLIDPQKLQSMFFHNLKGISILLEIDVDIKGLMKSQPEEYSTAFLKQKL